MEKKKVADWVMGHKVKQWGSHIEQKYVWRKNVIGQEAEKVCLSLYLI